MAKKAAPKAAEAPKAAKAAVKTAKAAKTAKPAKAAAKTAAADKAAKPAPKPITKTEIYSRIAESTELTKKEVASVFEAMSALIGDEIGKKGPGLFVVPGLLKIKVVHKPATKERQGFNPKTKEPITIEAKPARKVVKVLPLKALKEFI